MASDAEILAVSDEFHAEFDPHIDDMVLALCAALADARTERHALSALVSAQGIEIMGLLDESDALQAAVARVRAVEVAQHDGPCGGHNCDAPDGAMMWAADVLAALDGAA